MSNIRDTIVLKQKVLGAQIPTRQKGKIYFLLERTI